jgi:FAD/FMN-containing dehydrogenase
MADPAPPVPPSAPLPAAVLAELAAVLGPAGALTRPEDVAPYLVDWRRLYHGAAPLVARPASVAEVAAVVGICAAHRVGIVPHGGNTSYCGGATPRESGGEIVLSLGRLNRIREIDPAGWTVTVEAGCTLAAVREAAHAAGRLFPLSLGSEGTAQIGGNLSTNAGGTSVLRYGMMRDLVLGLEVVLPDGRVLDQLRRLRKDNTGYDVKQLFLGAEGTLGVITAAVLKLYALPADHLTAFVALDGIAAAVALLGRVREEFGDDVVAFEYLPRVAHELAVRHIPGTVVPFPAPHPAYALVELAVATGAGALAGRFDDFLAGEVDAGRVRDAAVAGSLAQRDALWHLREHVPEAQTREGPSIKHDVSLPVARLPEFVAEAERLLARLAPGARIVGYGHVGDGNLHFNLSPREGADPAELAAFAQLAPSVGRAVHDLVAALGGSFSAEHGIGRLKVGELERYEDPVALATMRAIKRALDPLGIMNPGKVLAEDRPG